MTCLPIPLQPPVSRMSSRAGIHGWLEVQFCRVRLEKKSFVARRKVRAARIPTAFGLLGCGRDVGWVLEGEIEPFGSNRR